MVFTVAAVLTCFGMQAQTLKQKLKFADKLYGAHEYYGASKYYKEILDLEPTNIEIMHKYTDCLRQYNEYAKAQDWYLKIYKKDRGRTYPMDVFYLAQMYRYNGNYPKAKKYYKKCVRFFRRDKKSFEYRKIQQEMLACNKAGFLSKDSLPIDVKNLGKGVNSTESEFAPFIKDSTLYFSTLRSDKIDGDFIVSDTNDYYVRIMKAARDGETWVNPKEMPKMINEKGYMIGNTSINAAGTRLYYSKCKRNGPCKLMMCKFENGKWSKPEELDKLNEEGYTTTQPMEAKIGGKNVLFFVSDRPNGVGKMDIWYSIRNDFGAYSKPVNIGEPVNTIDNEITPFYSIEDQTLYFSSEWHIGLGGFDVFSSKGDLNGFEKPENMKPPINTSVNDFYYIKHGNEHMLASNRIGSFTTKSATCCNDIYTYKTEGEPDSVPTLSTLMKYLPLRLYFHNDRPNPRTTDTITQWTYPETYTKYQALRAEYKREYSKGMSGDDKEDAVDDIDNLFDEYIEKGFNDLHDFYPLLKKELDAGKHIELTIKGYASPLSGKEYNVHLTLRRISSLMNYLERHDFGALRQYISGRAANGGKLTFVKQPYGEYTADTNKVSDDYYDTRNSIYNPGAALERRIEIIAVSEKDSVKVRLDGKEEEKLPQVQFDVMEKNVGTIPLGGFKEVEFTVTNTGEVPLEFFQADVPCSCTEAELPKEPIAPGEKGTVKFKISHKGRSGPVTVDVQLLTNTKPNRKIVTIKGTMANQ